MAKARALDRRRKSIRSIRKITRTMELISTAQFKRAMDRAVAATAYTRRITALVSHLAHAGLEVSHPLLEPRPEPKKAILLALTANRGLCAGYNSNVFHLAVARREELVRTIHEIRLEVSGKRGISAFRFRNIRVDESFIHFNDKPSFAEVDALAVRYLADFTAGAIDRLDVVYTKFESASRQQAVVETLLPLGDLAGGDAGANAAPSAGESQYEFLPSAASILDEVVPTSFKVKLFQVFFGRRRERADRPDGGDEGRDGERRQHDFAIVDGLQPRAARADHRRTAGDYRRGRGVKRMTVCQFSSAES